MYKIGQTIEITTKYQSHYIYRTEEFAYNHYTGVVIPNPKWLEHPNHVTIKTADGMTRIIDLGNVVGATSTTPTTLLTRTFKVTSKSKGSEYLVTVEGSRLSCTCVGFQFRRMCKHSTAVSNKFLKNQ